MWKLLIIFVQLIIAIESLHDDRFEDFLRERQIMIDRALAKKGIEKRDSDSSKVEEPSFTVSTDQKPRDIGRLNAVPLMKRKEALIEVPSQCANTKSFALTFEDGPSLDYTASILEVLKKKSVKATFFVNVQLMPSAQAITEKMIAGGHLIGLKFIPVSNDMNEDDFRKSLTKEVAMLTDEVGLKIKYIRLPYQQLSNKYLKICQELGLIATEHSLDSRDYVQERGIIVQSFSDALNNCEDDCPGFISIQRDAIKETADRLPLIIEMVKEKGYKLVRVDACLKKDV